MSYGFFCRFFNNTWVPWLDTKRRVIVVTDQRLTILAAVVAGVAVGLVASAAIIMKMFLGRQKCEKR
jgi:hypothetical protein